jgi:hypothetical protein
MDAAELILELESRGARVAVVGDRVRVEAPAGAVDPSLDEAIKAKKIEILELMRGSESSPPVGADTPAPSREPTDPTMEAALADFKRYGGGIRLFSRVLDVEVWLASDEAAAQWLEGEKDGRPVFTFEEIDFLEGALAADLKVLASVKQAIPGCRIRAFTNVR